MKFHKNILQLLILHSIINFIIYLYYRKIIYSMLLLIFNLSLKSLCKNPHIKVVRQINQGAFKITFIFYH